MNQSVGITGMGILSSLGADIPAFSAALKAGRSGIARAAARPGPERVPALVAAEISGLAFRESLAQRQELPEAVFRTALRLGHRAPFPIQVSILAALEAWLSAGFFGSRPVPSRIALVIAGQNTTQNYQYGLLPKFKENPEYLSPRYGLEFLESNQIGVLSEILGIQGEGFVVGGASATGNVGLIKALQMLQAGWVDACLVVGVVADLSPMDIQGFLAMGAMGGKRFADQPDQACRPFDAGHEGFIYGQAGACVILESEASATRRGMRALAGIRGGAIVLDGHSSSAPSVEGEARAMLEALERSGLSPADIGYVNAHGSSSPLGDRTEAEAISRVFGSRAPEVWINATKGLTGHCLYSAGVVEAIATVLQMHAGFLHPNRNLEDPIHRGLRFCGPEAIEADIHRAVSNSFGFGGINSSVVLERG